ncbi:uncharacterized protein SCODWIG_00301 [Saccharomycodes ludwigii]|uniref:C2 NT-type domain-containing protein n=1 Tax=Saccharomycodes ludwigii TaxID=36035 RepID=A0A376B334_9ASCO|nr:uncharacterized protein SCODWIG_00301 [Saccharomycodes ludwigii]
MFGSKNKSRRPKFLFRFHINELTNIPQSFGYCYIKWSIKDGNGSSSSGGFSPSSPTPSSAARVLSITHSHQYKGATPKVLVKNHRARWNYSLDKPLQVKLNVDKQHKLEDKILLLEVYFEFLENTLLEEEEANNTNNGKHNVRNPRTSESFRKLVSQGTLNDFDNEMEKRNNNNNHSHLGSAPTSSTLASIGSSSVVSAKIGHSNKVTGKILLGSISINISEYVNEEENAQSNRFLLQKSKVNSILSITCQMELIRGSYDDFDAPHTFSSGQLPSTFKAANQAANVANNYNNNINPMHNSAAHMETELAIDAGSSIIDFPNHHNENNNNNNNNNNISHRDRRSMDLQTHRRTVSNVSTSSNKSHDGRLRRNGSTRLSINLCNNTSGNSSIKSPYQNELTQHKRKNNNGKHSLQHQFNTKSIESNKNEFTNSVLEKLYEKTYQIPWDPRPGEYTPKECIENIFEGGDGWAKNDNGVDLIDLQALRLSELESIEDYKMQAAYNLSYPNLFIKGVGSPLNNSTIQNDYLRSQITDDNNINNDASSTDQLNKFLAYNQLNSDTNSITTMNNNSDPDGDSTLDYTTMDSKEYMEKRLNWRNRQFGNIPRAKTFGTTHLQKNTFPNNKNDYETTFSDDTTDNNGDFDTDYEDEVLRDNRSWTISRILQ